MKQRINGAAMSRAGRQFEHAVVVYAESHGLEVHHLRDPKDLLVGGWYVEVKAQRAHEFAAFMDQAILRSEGRPPLVVVKRFGQPIERAYVVMELGTAVEALRNAVED